MKRYTMRVTKRSGRIEDMKFDNVTNRIKNLTYELSTNCDSSKVAQQVFSSLYDGITTHEIDTLSAEICVGMITSDPDYEILATRIVASNIQKVCPKNFTLAMKKLQKGGIVTQEVADVSLQVKDDIRPERDFDFGYFGLKTLEKSYLQRMDGKIVETPQYMFMRVSIGIHGKDIPAVLDTYDKMSRGLFIHATPTLFNAGTPRPQLSSCFLIANKGDSIDAIYGTLTECAQISKWAGGIGMHIHNVRSNKSRIRGTNGQSDGIIPMLRVFNATARYVNQAGRRKGSIAVYLEPWHADIMDFLEIRLNQGDDEARCRDLFSALWIPDLFMTRVEAGGTWSLFCPDKAPGLADVYGEDFEALYTKYEQEGLANATVPAADVWKAILRSQTETGTPYMLYKDACNRKSNQKNLGVIKSSNLCVAPETKILTSEGQVTISELKGREVDVWNGDAFSRVTVHQTGENQKLVTVKTSKGLSLRCTPYHKFWIVGHDAPIEAQHLAEGMTIITHTMPDGEIRAHEKIVSVEDLGETADTFCFNEPLKHRGVFNGILTGNCTEIVEYTDENETSVCNLASIALPKYVDGDTKTFDYDGLHEVVKTVTKNLNRVIDRNFYPVETARRSNMKNRPIGLGVQGLADVFIMCGLPFDCEASRRMNAHIFETMYHAALEASSELAEVEGSYASFEGSPASQGVLQQDMWDGETTFSGRYDWDAMRERIKTKGLRNSLLLAPMPTASTAQILGNNECFEPYTTNIYLRRTLAGEFVVVNQHLVRDLKRVGLWSNDMKNLMVKAGGSIQNIVDIPDDIKALYKTVWEISQKCIIDMAADRGRFIDQSQSMNLFMESPTMSKLSSMHVYAWKSGLKTGMYYLRSKAKARPIQFSLEPDCVACSA
jgi:ribonucleotide reductase alpha subunit